MFTLATVKMHKKTDINLYSCNKITRNMKVSTIKNTDNFNNFRACYRIVHCKLLLYLNCVLCCTAVGQYMEGEINVESIKQTSLWRDTTVFPEYAALNGDIKTDVAVIGGGLAGILTAHFLEQAGRKCIVLEAERIGSGQTGNTTAKVTSQHGLIYNKLLANVGKEQAQQYADANQEAIERYRILIQKYGIECEWAEREAYLYTVKDARLLRQEYRAAESLGLPVELTYRTELPFPVEAALKLKGQASFHPLKFLQKMAEQVKVYEQTKVLRAEPHLLVTDRGNVRAEQIVFAGHYPFMLRPGYYFLRMHQERSYVLGLINVIPLSGMYLGVDADALSFRQSGNVLLFGGGGHRTGDGEQGNPYDYLHHKVEKYFPHAKAAYQWSAQDCMPLDGIPYIGQFGRRTEGWFAATGFQKWGMTSSMAAAMVLTDLMCGRKNDYADVFSPQRVNILASAKTFLEEGKYAVINLTKEKLTFPKEKLEDIRLGTGGIIEYQGQKAGVYKAEDGEIFLVSVKCPHLGCQLAWNQSEKSWDCPCHGSRYDYKGRLLDGPAQTASVACELHRDK